MGLPRVDPAITRTTALLSSATDGTIGNSASSYNAISGNGRYIAFVTSATNLGGAPGGTQNVYEKDRWTGTTTLISGDTGGGDALPPAVSSDGRFVGYVWNGSGDWQPYLRDVWTGQLVAPATLETIASPDLAGVALSTHQRTIAGLGVADRISVVYVSGSDVVMRTATVP